MRVILFPPELWPPLFHKSFLSLLHLFGWSVLLLKKKSKPNDWIRHQTPVVPPGLLWGHPCVSCTVPSRTMDLRTSRDSAVRQLHWSGSPWVSGPQKGRLFTTLQLWCLKTVNSSLFQLLKFLRMLLGPSESSHMDKLCLSISQYPSPPRFCFWLVFPETRKALPQLSSLLVTYLALSLLQAEPHL